MKSKVISCLQPFSKPADQLYSILTSKDGALWCYMMSLSISEFKHTWILSFFKYKVVIRHWAIITFLDFGEFHDKLVSLIFSMFLNCVISRFWSYSWNHSNQSSSFSSLSDSVVCLFVPFSQFAKQLWPVIFVEMSFFLFILTSALSVYSLPADTEKGRRKVVHVLGEDFVLFHMLNNCTSAR